MLLTLMAVVFIGQGTALPENLMIGGIFDEADELGVATFQIALDKINKDKKLIPSTTATGWIEKVFHDDSLETSKNACEFLRKGVTAIFGPSSPSSAAPHVRSLCNAKRIPHFGESFEVGGKYSVNLHPPSSTLNKAFSSLLSALKWEDYLLLYEDSSRLTYLQELLEKNGANITVRKLNAGSTGTDYRSQLLEIKKSGQRRFVLDCSSENLHRILNQAQQVGMMTEYQTYLVTSLDLHTVDWEDFKHGGARIFGMRLVNPNSERYQTVLKEIQQHQLLHHQTAAEKSIKTKNAIIYDGVLVWATALTYLEALQSLEAESIDCEADSVWSDGEKLINYIKAFEIDDGLTGKIRFDLEGLRKDFELDVVELKDDGLMTIGNWDSERGIYLTSEVNEIVDSFPRKVLIVTTILSEPYVMLKENSTEEWGDGRFEGYLVDLLKTLSKVLGMRYSIKLVEDGTYGHYDEQKKKWSGMIGELQSLEADLALADMVITQERAQVVDFTNPFMNLGITMLYKKSNYQPTVGLLAFLDPFSFDLWIYIFLAYVAVSSILYIISRFNPLENKSNSEDTVEGSNRTEDDEISSSRREGLTVLNSFWFILASLLAQRVDFLPRAFSTRIIAVVWWFFVLVMVTSYVANLAAFHTARPLESPIKSAEDLAKQRKIKYGAVRGGATAAFFRDSKDSTYANMWTYMNSNKNVFTSSVKEGVERVRKENGNYAFFAESTTVEYIVGQKCDLKQVGGLLDSKGFGIGLPKNSPYLKLINDALIDLQKKDELTYLKRKWWWGGWCWSGEPTYGDQFSFHSFRGMFLLLLVGLVLACLTACGEIFWIWWKKKNNSEA